MAEHESLTTNRCASCRGREGTSDYEMLADYMTTEGEHVLAHYECATAQGWERA